MNIGELVGKRVLLRVGTSGFVRTAEVTEYRVLEISPSGVWVLLMNLYGTKFWKPVQELSFIEELREIKPAPRDVRG